LPTLYLVLQSVVALGCARLGALARPAGRRHDERGQTSAEYALVLLGAAAIALLIVAWATNTDLIGKLFDLVIDAISGKVQ
jgi:Flp pilus assembly pilin Flp